MAVKYWVGGGSSTNWDATGNTNWSLTDGGANDAAVPAAQDDVFFKSAEDCVINAATSQLKSLDMTGYTGTMSGTSYVLLGPATDSGTVVCTMGGTLSGTWRFVLEPVGTTTLNLTSSGKTFGLLKSYYGTGTGTISQQDAITVLVSLSTYRGTWNTNGYSISSPCCQIGSDHTHTFNFTNSTINMTGSSGWEVNAASTITATGSTINITGTSGVFNSGKDGRSYNVVTFSGAGGIIHSFSSTFVTLNVNQAGNENGLKIFGGTTQTITNFTTDGYASNLAKIQSDVAESTYTLTKAGGGQVSEDYMSIKDCAATPASTWYAGANSTDVSGNSGWVFTTPPPEQGSTNLVCRLNIDYADTSTNLVCRINVYYIINTKNLVCQIDCVELISDWVEYTTPLNKNWRYIQIKIATS